MRGDSVMVFNATIGEGNWNTRRKPLTCRKPEYPEKTTDLPKTGIPGENHRPATDKLYHIIYQVHLTISCDGTDCIDSCKSNYHMTTTATGKLWLVG